VAAFIEVEHLTHAYPLDGGDRIVALRDVSLSIQRGEFVALIGSNGAGKSTLARHLNGLLQPTEGQVRVEGLSTSDADSIWAIRQRVGMVFQDPDNQLVASTVEEDVAFGPENMALPPDEIRRRVDEALLLVDLVDYRTHPPQMLSGGQKQRVAIAGALASRPACIVFDEPTSMLDPAGRRQVLGTIRRLNREEGLTAVLITHAMEEAVAADRVVAMHAGGIAMDGVPADVFGASQRLIDLGLDLPVMVEIARRLRLRGLPLPAGLLRLDELVEALC
jgi:energy-coupling factor transport system ATP-binding protein